MANAIYNSILIKLNEYKSKYYKNMLLKGSILTIGSLLTAFTLINILEYFGNFDNLLRGVLFFSFLALSLVSLYFWILIPALKLFNLNKPLSNHDAATQIGRYFPEIDDKLLNVLQLGSLQSSESDLIRASIEQKSANLNVINFVDAVRYEQNKKYLKYLLPPLLIVAVILVFVPRLFTETTPRIINYDKTFEVQAPFKFKPATTDMKVFKGEDFELKLDLEGSAFPEHVYIVASNGRRLRMDASKQGSFSYLFKNVQKDIQFYFEASGFSSSGYNLQVIARPNLSNFAAYLSYPAYIGKKDEKLDNTGNMIVPEGTAIKWVFKAQQTDHLIVQFDSTRQQAVAKDDNTFEFSKQIFKSMPYKVQLKNQFSTNKEAIEYYLNVIPDEYPVINIKQFEDTTLFNYLMIGGNIADDYGIKRLEFRYRVVNAEKGDKDATFQSTPLRHNPSLINQSYFHQVDLAGFNLQPGDKLEYFVQVWDNDGIHGSKSSKTTTYEFRIPDEAELREEMDKAASTAENQMEKSLEKAKELQKQIKEMEDKLKSKKNLTWQDKKAIEELLKKKEELVKDIEKLQEQNKMLNEQQERFSEQDKEIAKKSEQLQKLMDELLDEETKKLYEELNKLLQQEYMNNNYQELLNKIDKKESNLQKELDRALEMFKKLQFEKKAKETMEQLKDLSKEQEKLAEETKDSKNDKEGTEKLQEKQEKLNEEFKEVEKSIDELEKMNEEMKEEQQQNMDELQQQEKGVEKDQQESKESLQKNQNKKASQSQKSAAQKMQQMAQQMEQMQQSSESSEQMENYDDLRKILENLVKLSFDQEDVMKQFREVRQEDPRFVALGQRQLKLKDDAKIIEDSLMALSKRVFQIESFVTREVTAMNDYINQSLEEIKKRNVPVAVGKQQFTMTSINNLALMLNDVLEQMQQNLGQQMSGNQMTNKPGGKPQLSDLQKSLNQRIQELQKSGKSGRALSEELAKLAAEQEAIRKALQGQGQQGKGGEKGQKGQKDGKNGQQDGGKEGGGGNLGKALDEMEKTEEDLVNKKITEETIKRQKEILTRLLESERAMRERETEQQREAHKAKEKPRTVPAEFSEYLKVKEKQVELLKTIPASLNPYYKQKVNEYFKKINE